MFWSPESLGIKSRQNLILWNDMERAYAFIEYHAPYPISGDLQGFLFELIRRRWNLACAGVYEPPPSRSEHFSSDRAEIILEAPAGLDWVNVDNISLTKCFVDKFKEFAAVQFSNIGQEPSGKLYGYGTDGYGTYLPLHLLWPEQKAYWGIYISETGVLTLAADLYHHLGASHWRNSREDEIRLIGSLIQIAYQVILRHQLFHFKIEQWTLLLELATGHAYYKPYLHYVYLPTIYDLNDNNLEEALANVSILLSTKIKKTEKEFEIYVSGYLETFFLMSQGPSYRNLDLMWGVPTAIANCRRGLRYREVVNYLCNQILRHELRPTGPFVPYYLYPPNNNFLRAENLCPIYLIRNLPYEAGVIA
jgi:hypothetical protein